MDVSMHCFIYTSFCEFQDVFDTRNDVLETETRYKHKRPNLMNNSPFSTTQQNGKCLPHYCHPVCIVY